MKRSPLRLRGISGEIKGQVWESDTLLRAGRLGSLEIVLDDSSVSRRHAEVRHGDDGWHVRDLESTNGTYVNGVRIGTAEQQLKARDIVQFGKVAVIVEMTEATVEGPPSNQHVVAGHPGVKLTLLDVQGFPIPARWHLVTRSGRPLSPAAEAFRQYMRREAMPAITTQIDAALAALRTRRS